MARGFESKSVMEQQEAAEKERETVHEDLGQASVVIRRRKLELGRIDMLRQMEAARADAHREMLRRALASLDKDLAELN